jgi:hypothetical protein
LLKIKKTKEEREKLAAALQLKRYEVTALVFERDEIGGLLRNDLYPHLGPVSPSGAPVTSAHWP